VLAVDETAVKIIRVWSWSYAAIDTKTILILDVALFGRHGTDPATAFLHGTREKRDLSGAEFLVHQFSYQIVLDRLGPNGQVNYTDQNLI
jgi:putative transposase